MEAFKEKVKNIIAKLKTIKNIEIIAGVVIICIVAVIYSSVSASNKTSSNNTSNSTISTTSTNSGITDGIEDRLSNILSAINGAGKVSVMITFASTSELVVASTNNTNTNSSTSQGVTSSTTTETKTPIVVTNNGKSELVILKEVMPEVMGVIVVAEGAGTAKVKLELQRAVQAILGINSDIIQIFAMK